MPDDLSAHDARPFRTAFQTRLDFRGASDVVRDQLRAWLKDKGLDVRRFDAGVPEIGPGAVLFYAATNASAGWQLRERRDDGVTWVSTVTVTHDGRHPDDEWVSLSIEAMTPPGRAAPMARPPKLIRLLLDTLGAYDGEAELCSQPALVSAGRVEDLLVAVCDPDRRLPVVVAAAPVDGSFEAWRATAADIMRDLPGLAGMYVLDPNATPLFNEGIGTTHWIGAGCVRTYLPGTDPAVELDAARHRVLSRRRIEADPPTARRLLAAIPRRLAANAVPPTASAGLTVSVRDFARQLTSSPDDGELTRLRDQVALLDQLLLEADGTERLLRGEVSRHQDELMDLAHDLENTIKRLERFEVVNLRLRDSLVAANRYDEAFAQPVEQPWLPTSLDELLGHCGELEPYVLFTGDRAHALALDEHPQSAPWAQLGWQSLAALHDYAKARSTGDFTGDFKMWCESQDCGGRSVAPGKVARDESPTVRQTRKFARPRTFPVPESVDPAGRLFMGAHIRLGSDAQISPRLHYHDAVAVSGAVIVGYIGRHLPNTLTS